MKERHGSRQPTALPNDTQKTLKSHAEPSSSGLLSPPRHQPDDHDTSDPETEDDDVFDAYNLEGMSKEEFAAMVAAAPPEERLQVKALSPDLTSDATSESADEEDPESPIYLSSSSEDEEDAEDETLPSVDASMSLPPASEPQRSANGLVDYYIEKHPFMGDALNTHTVSDRRAFTRDIYDYARARNMTSSQASEKVEEAREQFVERRVMALVQAGRAPDQTLGDDGTNWIREETPLGSEIDDSDMVLALAEGTEERPLARAIRGIAEQKGRELAQHSDSGHVEEKRSKRDTHDTTPTTNSHPSNLGGGLGGASNPNTDTHKSKRKRKRKSLADGHAASNTTQSQLEMPEGANLHIRKRQRKLEKKLSGSHYSTADSTQKTSSTSESPSPKTPAPISHSLLTTEPNKRTSTTKSQSTKPTIAKVTPASQSKKKKKRKNRSTALNIEKAPIASPLSESKNGGAEVSSQPTSRFSSALNGTAVSESLGEDRRKAKMERRKKKSELVDKEMPVDLSSDILTRSARKRERRKVRKSEGEMKTSGSIEGSPHDKSPGAKEIKTLTPVENEHHENSKSHTERSLKDEQMLVDGSEHNHSLGNDIDMPDAPHTSRPSEAHSGTLMKSPSEKGLTPPNIRPRKFAEFVSSPGIGGNPDETVSDMEQAAQPTTPQEQQDFHIPRIHQV
ncbi:MAG: hypothetical protein M1819_003649 [Sarea resinae]|nr:MAG: hypothetical protein M1819_003649 [Sarea resinae]